MNKAARSIISGTIFELHKMNQHAGDHMIRHACRAVGDLERERHRLNADRTTPSTWSSPQVRQSVADELRGDVDRVIEIALETADVSPANLTERRFLLSERVKICAKIVHNDLTTEGVLNESHSYVNTSNMDMLRTSLRGFLDDFTADLIHTAGELVAHGSTPATDMDAETLRSIVNKFAAWRPSTRAERRLKRSQRCLSRMMQGLQTTTKLRLTALRHQDGQSGEKEQRDLSALGHFLESEIERYDSLAGEGPDDEEEEDIEGWREKEPSPAEPGEDIKGCAL